MSKVKVGIIGCGKISGIYFTNLQTYDLLEVKACADLDLARAQAKAKEFQIPVACTVKQLLGDPDIQIVINLTVPQAHAEICLAALEAGKHVYVEKPLAVTRGDARRILDKAKQKNLLVGCAPDTFLGGGIQTSRKLIDDGWIGRPVAASAFMMSGGHESWHPDPEFYYLPGGGPMFDMGPYYLTALVHLLGPIRRVTGSANITFAERTITSEPKFGQVIQVQTPTHVTGILDFASGATATMITSFDIVGGSALPRIEIYGSEGTLSVPNPNTYAGPVRIRGKEAKEWSEVPLTHGYTDNSRGLGVLDMAYALRSGRTHRANGELAYHVLEAMHGIHDAAKEGRHYEMKSTCEQPAPLPLGLRADTLDE
ncbi:Gfo/Idh/MocA family protein [Paenibacillus sp. J2TS4]|uniref:Gfo/Idh/MocA family protein n=1 Tax=Paenibacillus sp. J2TS4 TaxID=2807194 RepID=UPI001B172940|nr:Gfo/Idh/MocA family oxidoreductase [Paenibacillus sp. J2TS4]GIP33864.1 dehydrogenase [Paenibacillus sp. J2TS4]